MLNRTISILLVLGAMLIASRSDACATIFQDPNYRGRTMGLSTTTTCWGTFEDDWDKQISSIRPDDNCYVILWDDIYCKGAGASFPINTASLSTWDNRARSLQCICH